MGSYPIKFANLNIYIMKVLIDIEDVKRFILEHSEEEDEWYASERVLVGDPIVNFLVWAGKDKAAKEVKLAVADKS
jgi:hypothetical protein